MIKLSSLIFLKPRDLRHQNHACNQ